MPVHLKRPEEKVKSKVKSKPLFAFPFKLKLYPVNDFNTIMLNRRTMKETNFNEDIPIQLEYLVVLSRKHFDLFSMSV